MKNKTLAAPAADVIPVHQFVLDGYGCDTARCDEIQRVWDLLDNLPAELGLAKATIPYLIPYYNGAVPEDCGITGIVYTLLGHITLHTFSKKQTLFLDITSPTPFDTALARRRVEEAFGVSHSEGGVPSREGLAALPSFESRCFGPHLTIDIADFDADRVDMRSVFDTLSELPADVNMTRIMTPYVIHYEMEGGEPAMSGMVLIAESHISFHLLPERRKGYVDLFSCKPFDVAKTLRLVRERLHIKRDAINLAPRGLQFER